MSLLVNAYCTALRLPEISFPHEVIGRRDLSDPELSGHLNGFIGYVLQFKKQEMTQAIYYTIQHIERVKNHLSIELSEDDFGALSDWAVKANAILFFTDGSIRNPVGETILPPGEKIVLPPRPPEAFARKARTDALLREEGIRVPQSLPPVLDLSELDPQSPSDCARRVLGLFMAAVRAESLAAEEPLSLQDLRERLPGAFDCLTPAERAFLLQDQPSVQEITNFTWRYECIALLLWSLGMLDPLVAPNQICDVPAIAKTILSADQTAFVRDAKFRPVSEILDQLDIHYRLQWLSHQSRVDGKDLPNGLLAGVITERLYALNWLTRTQDVPWDDIETPA
ncbi:MAG: DUF4272 domain-containing protein [Fibrobacterota bacterium]|nr:DUF4272 domain-containing protein [Fibrobacterota bacterium]QQS03509.1 MAG: DUF4272 domain-containing protein [Fibrobacterota bacterium]